LPLARAASVARSGKAMFYHCERVFLAFRQVYRQSVFNRGNDFRQSKENAVNSSHVPNPPALAIRAALAKAFRLIPYNLKKQIPIGIVVGIRRHDFLSRAVTIRVVGEQIGQRDSKGSANFSSRTPRFAVNQSPAIVTSGNGQAWRLVTVTGATGRPAIGGFLDGFQTRKNFGGGHVRFLELTSGLVWVYACINECWVPAAGVEPAIHLRNPLAKRARLPFRHAGSDCNS
jgi:hypothetical protein